jgi:hypothetical protein
MSVRKNRVSGTATCNGISSASPAVACINERLSRNPVSERVYQQHVLHLTRRAIARRASEETGFLVIDIRNARFPADSLLQLSITAR